MGLQGPRGTWGEGLGRQDSECRDGRWRTAGVDTYPGGKEIQDRKRGYNQVQRAVQLSLRVEDEGGVGTQRVKGEDPENI